MPDEHAKLCTPSSSERWLHCTAAPRYESMFPASSSVYADEGTLAHSVCEQKARAAFLHDPDIAPRLEILRSHELWSDEMLRTSDFYVEHLKEASARFEHAPCVAVEVRVDLSDWIPECFGTCDCVMIGDGVIEITDYKHGRGVEVSAVGNTQMRLYALGALKRYLPIFGDTIKMVRMSIVQPRITEDVSSDEITVDELLEWGKTVVKPKAAIAYSGFGTFNPGEWCRFCAGSAQCRERAKFFTGFERYLHPQDDTPAPIPDGGPVLSDAEIGDLLERAKGLAAWYSDLQDAALKALLAGREIPGWKVVEGRSSRAFSDVDEAISALRAAGFDDSILFEEPKARSLAALEKAIGKKKFGELVGELIVKPGGKPTLADAGDRRAVYQPPTPDASEFAGVQG